MDTSDKDITLSKTKMHINEYGFKFYKNLKGKYHRLNGPAIEYSFGAKYWYEEGSCHRTDGPAIEDVDGNKDWFILNKNLEEKDFNSWILRIRKCM